MMTLYTSGSIVDAANARNRSTRTQEQALEVDRDVLKCISD